MKSRLRLVRFAASAVLLSAAATLALAPSGAMAEGCLGAQDTATGTCYATIQEAVTGANPGDTLVVSPGTYNENVVIPAGKDGLTLKSLYGAYSTTINGSINSQSLSYNAIIDIESNNVTLGGGLRDGFTLTYGSAVSSNQEQLFGVSIGMTSGSSTLSGVTVAGNIIENLSATPAGSGFARVEGIVVTDSTHTTVSENFIENISLAGGASTNYFDYAILFFATNQNAMVTNNLIRNISQTGGSGCPGNGAFGIAINDSMTNATVANNFIYGISSSCLAAGISTSASGGTIDIADSIVSNVLSSVNYGAAIALKPSGATVTVTGDTLYTNTAGVAVTNPLGAGSYIHDNNLKGNGVGLYNASGGAVDAIDNWWGCRTGPNTVGCDTIVNVDPSTTTYTPFLRRPYESRDFFLPR